MKKSYLELTPGQCSLRRVAMMLDFWYNHPDLFDQATPTA